MTIGLEAERRVKVGLILEALAAKEGISVTNEDLNHEIARLAAEVKLSVDEVRRMIQAGGKETWMIFRPESWPTKLWISSIVTQ